jgi:hypothetical protein
MWFQIKRVLWDISWIIFLLIIAYFAPSRLFPAEAKIGFFSLFFSKFIFINAGIISAHVSRELVFPYIHFSEEKDPIRKIMIVVWYGVIIYAFAHGG